MTKTISFLFPKKMTYNLDCIKEDVSYVINFKCTNIFPTFKSFECNTKAIVEHINQLITNKYDTDINYHLALSKLIFDIIFSLTSDETILLSAIDYIHSHFADSDISNLSIANHCSISVIYLQKLFAKYVKQGTKRYINRDVWLCNRL